MNTEEGEPLTAVVRRRERNEAVEVVCRLTLRISEVCVDGISGDGRSLDLFVRVGIEENVQIDPFVHASWGPKQRGNTSCVRSIDLGAWADDLEYEHWRQ